MDEGTSPEPHCPDCDGTQFEPRGVVVACQPFERPKLFGVARFEKVIEHKYRCRDCSREFSVVEEIYGE